MAVYAVGTVLGFGVAAFTLWNDAYPAGVRGDAVVAVAFATAAVAGLGAGVWRPLPSWAAVLLSALVPVAFFVEFASTVSYWEEAAVRCQPPDPVLSDCGVVTTASDAALAGFAGVVGGLAAGSLVGASVASRARR